MLTPQIRTFRIALLVAAFGALQSAVPALLQAQQPPLRDLPKPAAEIDDPFSLVSAVLEISGGRVLIADGLESQLFAVNFSNGSKALVGRQGSGPGEYRAISALFRARGDTVWVLDGPQQRIVAFTGALTPGTTFPMMMANTETSTTYTAPMVSDGSGQIFASSMKMDFAALRGNAGRGGGRMAVPDTVMVVRIDPRKSTAPTELFKVRFPTSGTPEMQVEGNAIKYKAAYPGMVPADAWAVFPNGRIAIVNGANYTVTFVSPTGTRSAPKTIAYEKFPLTEADKKAEMDEVRRVMVEQGKAVQRQLPPNMTIDFEITPPATWPSVYPPLTPLAAFASPDGRLWVRRNVPTRIGREQWDVIDEAGTLIARWQLPTKTALLGVGAGVVYVARSDEDDLRYIQRVVVPR